MYFPFEGKAQKRIKKMLRTDRSEAVSKKVRVVVVVVFIYFFWDRRYMCILGVFIASFYFVQKLLKKNSFFS